MEKVKLPTVSGFEPRSFDCRSSARRKMEGQPEYLEGQVDQI